MLIECADVLIVTALVLIAGAAVITFGYPRPTRNAKTARPKASAKGARGVEPSKGSSARLLDGV